MRMKLLSTALGLSLLGGVVSQVVAAPVVELFTSQGCYSCPPADEFLAELIEQRPDVVALEFHVDYWDDLVYGSAGTWKDPFSQAAFTDRQRRYNQLRLNGRPGVYTPQMVVNGSTAAVGTSRRAVRAALDRAVPALQIDVVEAADKLDVTIGGGGLSNATVWVAYFDRQQLTEVSAGENKGKSMRNHHVVRELAEVAEWSPQRANDQLRLTIDPPVGRSCAILVQDKSLRQMLGAAYCPS